MLKTILKLLDNAKIFFITISVIQIHQLQKLPDNIEKAAKLLIYLLVVQIFTKSSNFT